MVESERRQQPLSTAERLAGELWADLGGAPEAVEQLRIGVCEPGLLPAAYDVTSFAAAAVGVATLAVAELGAVRSAGPIPQVAVDPVDAAAAFRSESLLEPQGWALPPIWDPIAGVYACADGFVRLHTNYPHHRAAVLGASGLVDGAGLDRGTVAGRVAALTRADVETRVVAAGGCAAAMYSAQEWAQHEHGRVALGQPPIAVLERGSRRRDDVRPSPRLARAGSPGRPLEGIRVLDLTRVIAGPVATRTLAAWGADVLRIDPPGFAEVAALLPDVTVGKRCAGVDLAGRDGAATIARLVAEADVVVHGLRPGALAGLGLGEEDLRLLNPAVVSVALDAYGWAGPWSGRRGFDSLVQFSCGIAAGSGVDGAPGALPAQALDHGSGYLLAAAACRGLVSLIGGAGPPAARGSLLGAANLLTRQQIPIPVAIGAEVLSARRVPRGTAWGDVLAVPQPGEIGGLRGAWREPAGPLGRHEPGFATIVS